MTFRIAGTNKTETAAMALVKGAVLLIVLSFLLTPLSRGRSSEGRAAEPFTTLPARVTPAASYPVTVDVAAQVSRVDLSLGDRVEAGQVLAQLESSELRAERQRAALRLKVAAHALELSGSAAANPRTQLLDEQYRAAMVARDAAQRRLSEYRLAIPADNYARARAALDRVKRLAARQLATEAEVEAAVRQEQAESRNLGSAKEQRQRLEEELAAAESRVAQAKIQLSSLDGAEAEVARFNYEEAQNNVKALEERTERLTVRAPAAGRVIQVNAVAGSRVAAGTVIFMIADLSKLQFEVPVSAKVAQSLHAGDSVEVSVPKDPPIRVSAQISNILLTPEQQQPYLVRVTIANPNPDQLLVGMEGAIRFSHDQESWARRLLSRR